MLLFLALMGVLVSPSPPTVSELGPESSFGAQVQAAIGGDTDWIIPAGQVVVFDTAFSIVNGQPVTGGAIAVRNFQIQPGAVLSIQGPNPLVVTASGRVRIEGLLDLSGMGHPGANSIHVTSAPMLGAPGQAGGGRGGAGSPQTLTKSARGGPGAGAFEGPGGGFGGETGWSNGSAVNDRRGAGGGGGRLGADVFDQSQLGLDAEPGFNSNASANGALSGPGPAHGGSVGRSPFTDADPRNDHYGLMLDRSTGALIPGELKRPWAGAGGGGGGDAARVPSGQTFPGSPVTLGDERGAGGGGGGGSLHLMALGPIEVVGGGKIKARGGRGGGGENTIFLNRVGGGSGGGSGGHVVLETAACIDLSGAAGAALLATGGQGGAGKDNQGGAWKPNLSKETKPEQDACPPGQIDCLGHVEGAGGDGGPGLIQLHVPPAFGAGSNLRLPAGVTLAELSFPLPVGAGTGGHLIPTFRSGVAKPVFRAAARKLSAEDLRLRPVLGFGSLRD